MVVATRASSAWRRYAWVAGILYVIALVAETVVGLLGGSVSQNDSAAKIANVLYDHRERLLVITYLSVVYAAMFLIYLGRLYDLLRGNTDRSRFLGSLVLAGGALFIALHAVSDIGINGLLGAKLASFGFQHDQGMSYTLYLLTYGLDSVGDVFGSLFAFAAGVLVIEHGVLPRWLGWVSILVGILFFLQGFGLGGVIASFGLVLDLIGFVLFLIFVLVSSVILLTRTAPDLPDDLHETTDQKGTQRQGGAAAPDPAADGLVGPAVSPPDVLCGSSLHQRGGTPHPELGCSKRARFVPMRWPTGGHNGYSRATIRHWREALTLMGRPLARDQNGRPVIRLHALRRTVHDSPRQRWRNHGCARGQ